VDKAQILDNQEQIKGIDRKGMLETVAEIPEMLLDAASLSNKISVPAFDGIRHIVFAGMGGSAISGDIASDLLRDKVKLPFSVNRSYRIPSFVDQATLFFAVSYSGNTEETLAATGEAAKRGAKIVCVTSGGKLKDIAEKKGYPLCAVPTGFQPRAALPYLLIPILKVLGELGFPVGGDEEIAETVRLLQKLKKDCGPSAPLRSNPAKQLAAKLPGKIPMVFAVAESSASAGLRLKTQLNENSKVTAVFNIFPELNHNEIVNLSALKHGGHNFCLVFLRSEGDHERVAKRMEITKSLIGTELGGVNEIWAKGKSAFCKILSLIYFGDLVSVYLALLQGVDPTEVEIITRLKRELAR
jgi:glucose/mannose-6-phosphate isomerase